MCLAPLLHRKMSLFDRCSTGLCGFITMDLFRLLAHQHCQRLRLPTGSCWMAGQTCSNLQSCAVMGAIIGFTKPLHCEPWRHSQTRLCEIAIEHFFGALRAQSSNSQLSARSYWIASAREALKKENRLNSEKPTPGTQKQLSSEELLGHTATSPFFSLFQFLALHVLTQTMLISTQ